MPDINDCFWWPDEARHWSEDRQPVLAHIIVRVESETEPTCCAACQCKSDSWLPDPWQLQPSFGTKQQVEAVSLAICVECLVNLPPDLKPLWW